MTADFNDDLARFWEALSNRIIDRQKVANQLEELLRDEGITQQHLILDVAGGFGFPVIELAKKGYQIVYNDGSQEMFQRAFANAEKAGVPLYPFQAAVLGDAFCGGYWKDLKGWDSDLYHALICRGNSLPYAVSWGQENPDLSRAREEIVDTLATFYRLLTPGGVFYVDKQPESQYREVHDAGEVDVDGQSYYLRDIIDNDRVKRIRNWTLYAKELKTGKEITCHSQGYLLLEDELLPLLAHVGFRHIRKVVLAGDIYEGFVARKPGILTLSTSP